MADIDLKLNIIKLKRFSFEFSLNTILMLLYFPFGVLILIIRLLLCLTIIPIFLIRFQCKIRKNLLNILSPFFGVWIKYRIPEKRISKFLISNHVSNIDSIVLSLFIDGDIMFKNLFFSPTEKMVFDAITMMKPNSHDFVQICFVENTISHGVGIMKFKLDHLDVNQRYGIIGINIERPFFDISISTESSNFVTDLLFLLFCPLTILKIFALDDERMTFSNSDKGSEFLQEARKKLSDITGIPLIEIDFIEKNRIIKQMGVNLENKEMKYTKRFETINKVGDEMYQLRKKMLYEVALKNYQNNEIGKLID